MNNLEFTELSQIRKSVIIYKQEIYQSSYSTGRFFLSVYNRNMAEKVLQFNAKVLLGELNNIERVLLPRASYISLNRAVFDARVRLQKEAKNRFNNVSRLTNDSFLYEKPKQIGNSLEASVYIRPRIPKGNAPSKYLAPQIYGGSAYRTRFQRALERSQTYLGRDSEPILSSDKIMSPIVKISPRTYSTITGQMRGTSKPKNKRYFYIGDKIQRAASKNGKKPPKKGIYFRASKNDKINMILFERDTPSYTSKFKFFDYGKDEVAKSFKKNLLQELKRK